MANDNPKWTNVTATATTLNIPPAPRYKRMGVGIAQIGSTMIVTELFT